MTPGVKDHVPDYDTVKVNESEGPLPCDGELEPEVLEPTVRRLKDGCNVGIPICPIKKSVDLNGSLHSRTTFHDVVPYSEIYTVNPSTIAATNQGFKICFIHSGPIDFKTW